MNKYWIWIFGALLLVAIYYFGLTPVLAQDKPQKAEVLLGDQFLSGDIVTLNEAVKGDVYIGAGQVNIERSVEGDLIIAGGIISVNAPVKGNIRVAGGQVTVNDKVSGNVTVFSGMFTLTPDAKVGGGVVVGAGTVVLSGEVGKSIRGWVGQMQINGQVKGNVHLDIDQLDLGSAAAISGNLTYASDKTVAIAQGAQVLGETKQEKVERASYREQFRHEGIRGLFGAFFAWRILSFFMALFLSFIVLIVFPRMITSPVDLLSREPLRAFVVGLVTLMVAPVAVIMLVISILGIPLALVLGFFLVIVLYLSGLVFSFWLGRKLVLVLMPGQIPSIWLSMLIGLFLTSLLIYIPILGWLIKLMGVLMSFGAMVSVSSRWIQRYRTGQAT